MQDITLIYYRLNTLREMKLKAINQNKDNLAVFCYKQIKLIKKINISKIN